MSSPVTLNLLSTRKLLALYASLLDALRSRGVLRSANNPLADYAEGLCARAMGWTLVYLVRFFFRGSGAYFDGRMVDALISCDGGTAGPNYDFRS